MTDWCPRCQKQVELREQNPVTAKDGFVTKHYSCSQCGSMIKNTRTSKGMDASTVEGMVGQ